MFWLGLVVRTYAPQLEGQWVTPGWEKSSSLKLVFIEVVCPTMRLALGLANPLSVWCIIWLALFHCCATVP